MGSYYVIVFLISVLDNMLSIYRNIEKFICWICIWKLFFLVLTVFCGVFRVIYWYILHQSVNSGNVSSFLPWMSFRFLLWLIALARTSILWWHKWWQRVSFFFLIIEGSFGLSIIESDIGCGLAIYGHSILRNIPSIYQFAVSFCHVSLLNFVKCSFCKYLHHPGYRINFFYFEMHSVITSIKPKNSKIE